jgi:predicted nucleotide-binding protein
MANENQLIHSGDSTPEPLDLILGEFNNAMVALQMQDLSGSEQSLAKARNTYRIVSTGTAGVEIIQMQVLVSFIEVISRFLKSTWLTYEERFRKALDELVAAKITCDNAVAAFDKLTDAEDEDEIQMPVSLFRYLFVFFNCIIDATKESVQGQVDMADGKFVDEIQGLRNATASMRKINDFPFPQDSDGTGAALAGMLNRMADLYEKKIERLVEKRRTIEYIKPIDRKVFIVHGQAEAIKLELKSILTNLKIEPVILSEMPDNGRTVIEKFENYARFCAFAYVIITPDDFVENKKKKYFQGRPNVLFELGWFSGRFGRDKVRILRQKDTDLPSDLSGLVTVNFNERLEEVYRSIAADLQQAGIIDKV